MTGVSLIIRKILQYLVLVLSWYLDNLQELQHCYQWLLFQYPIILTWDSLESVILKCRDVKNNDKKNQTKKKSAGQNSSLRMNNCVWLFCHSFCGLEDASFIYIKDWSCFSRHKEKIIWSQLTHYVHSITNLPKKKHQLFFPVITDGPEVYISYISLCRSYWFNALGFKRRCNGL